MFYESKPLEGKPDKNVNGYDLTGIGSVYGDTNINEEDYYLNILDLLEKFVSLYKTDLEDEIIYKGGVQKSIDSLQEEKKKNGLNDYQMKDLSDYKTTLSQIEHNSIPAYKRVIEFIETILIPFYENIETLDSMSIIRESMDRLDEDYKKLVPIIEYYLFKNNISLTSIKDSEYRTIINTILYKNRKTVRQNDIKKNEAGALNEAVFTDLVLNNKNEVNPETLIIDPTPYTNPDSKFVSSDVTTKSGDKIELKTVFKETESGDTYDKFIFYVPVKKIKELEKYKKSHPNNTVRVYWQTSESKPSSFISSVPNIKKDDYVKNQYYLDIKDENTLPDSLITGTISGGVNQESYKLGEDKVALFGKKVPDTYIKRSVPANSKDYIKKNLTEDEKSQYDMLTPMEKHKYLNSRFINGVFHSVSLRNIFNNITYRDVKDKLNTRRLTKNEKSDFDLLTSTQKTQYLIKRFQDKMSHSDALKDVKTSP
jgi:hypothetical protein